MKGSSFLEEDWEKVGWVERGKRGVFRWMTGPQRRYGELNGRGEAEGKGG